MVLGPAASDLAVSLLSTTNAREWSSGFVAFDRALRQRGEAHCRDLAAAVEALYSWFAYRYNANTIFLSLWPWTALFVIRSLESERRSNAVLFGIFAACDMLSKYYAVLLLATCALAACVHPQRWVHFTSFRPCISFATGALLFAPLLWWLAQDGFPRFHFFASETGHSWSFALIQHCTCAVDQSPAARARWVAYGSVRPETPTASRPHPPSPVRKAAGSTLR
jgi:hypothetical protein